MDVTDAYNKEFPANLAELPLDVAKKTLETAEKADICCSEGRNCLFYAVLRSDEDEACELSRLILEQEVVPGSHTDGYGQTALFYAAREGHLRCVEMLVQEFLFDVSHVDLHKQTPLFYAARDGRTETLQFLIEHGAEVNHVDSNGDTAIFYAARDGRAETIHRMLELGADCSIRNKKKAYVSTIARKNGYKELAADLDARRKSQAVAKLSEAETQTPSSTRGGRRRRPAARASIRQKRPPPREAAESPAPKRRLRRRASYTHASDSASEVEPEPSPVIASPADALPPSELELAAAAPLPLPAPPPPPPPPPEPPRISYSLQFLGPDRLWTFATPAKVREFEALFPQIAVWQRSEPLPEIGLAEDPFRAKWHQLALQLVTVMLEGDVEGAWLFAQPVDPKEWDIQDYFNVVKTPIDFSTIRNLLLKETHYRTIAAFWEDVQLVFSNCILYNSAASKIGQICLKVQSACAEHAVSIGVTQMLAEERMREDGARSVADSILGPDQSSAAFLAFEEGSPSASATDRPLDTNNEDFVRDSVDDPSEQDTIDAQAPGLREGVFKQMDPSCGGNCMSVGIPAADTTADDMTTKLESVKDTTSDGQDEPQMEVFPPESNGMLNEEKINYPYVDASSTSTASTPPSHAGDFLS